MPPIAIPTPGAPVLDSWGAAITAAVNKVRAVQLTSDVSENTGSQDAIDELAIEMVAGRVYVARLFGSYEAAHTSQGLEMGWTEEDSGATSLDMLMLEVADGGPTTYSRYRATDPDTLVGATTVDGAGTRRAWYLDMVWTCATTGTWKPVFARGGGNSTAPGVTLHAGSGGIVLEAA